MAVKLPPYGVSAVVQNYNQFLKQIGGMDKAVQTSHRSMASLGKIALTGLVKGAAAAAAAVGLIGAAAVGVGLKVGKVLFDIAEKSAYMVDINEAFDLFTKRAGAAADVTLKLWSDAAGGVVTNIDLMSIYNESTRRLGETLTKSLPEAFPLLKKAAESSGDSFAAFTRKLLMGVGRLRVAQLGVLGINIDLQQMTDDYAKSLGKTAKDITDDEKRTLVMAEALKQLEADFGDLVPTMKESDDVFERIRVSITNAKDAVKLAITKAFLPFAEDIEKLGEKVLPLLVKAFNEKLLPALTKAMLWMRSFLPKAIERLMFWLKIARGGWLKLTDVFRTEVLPRFRLVVDMVKVGLAKALQFITPFIDRFRNMWAIFSDWVTTTFLPKLGEVRDWLVTKWTEAMDAAGSLWDRLITKWGQVRDWATANLLPIFERIRAWLAEKLQVAVDAASVAWDAFKAKLTEIGTWYKQEFLPSFQEQAGLAPDRLRRAWEDFKVWWDANIMPIWRALTSYWQNILFPIIRALVDVGLALIVAFWNQELKPALDAMLLMFQNLGGGMGIFNDLALTFQRIGQWLAPLLVQMHDFANTLRALKPGDQLERHSPSGFEKTLWGINDALAAINTQGMPQLGGGQMSPMRAGPVLAGGAGGSATNNAYNLTVHTRAAREPIVADFRMMQALAQRR